MPAVIRREGWPQAPKGRWASRNSRIDALIALARVRAASLRREMFSAPRGSEARDLTRRRLARIDRRIRRLSALARVARRPAEGLVTQ